MRFRPIHFHIFVLLKIPVSYECKGNIIGQILLTDKAVIEKSFDNHSIVCSKIRSLLSENSITNTFP